MKLRVFCLLVVIVSSAFVPFDTAEAKKRRSPSTDRRPAQESSESDASNEDDAFDPFADFSEFQSNPEEQEDINFFKNGRMLTAGFIGGLNNFTNEAAQKFQPSMRFGLFMSYFFDLHFAVQISWLTLNAPVAFRTPTSTLLGNANMNSLGFSIKYFMNTQNVTKGLADLNPYFLVGMNNHNMSIRFSGESGALGDGSSGFTGGMGVEIPMMRKKMFWGALLCYELTGFKLENMAFVNKSVNYGTARGDMWSILGTVGLNF